MLETDAVYLRAAAGQAQLSTARRLRVGCVCVRNSDIIARGHNACSTDPAAACEMLTDQGLVTKPTVVHAEVNALLQLLRSGQSSLGLAVFITHAPCLNCSILLAAAGVSRIVFADLYRDHRGLEYLASKNLEVLHATNI